MQRPDDPTSSYEAPINYYALDTRHIQIYRLIRLRALIDSPQYFTSTLARELAFQPAEWTSRMSDPEVKAFVASRISLDELTQWAERSKDWNTSEELEQSDEHLDGTITCVRSFDDPKEALIVRIWVAPGMRKKGIGKTLIQKALHWAENHSGEKGPFERVIMDVLKDNNTARRVYEACGFKNMGENPEGGVHYVYEIS